MYEEYFNLLEVDKNVTLDELKSVFRRKAFQFHPDRNNSHDAYEKFILIKEAYDKIQIFLSVSQKNEEFIHYNRYNSSTFKSQSQDYCNNKSGYRKKTNYQEINKSQKKTLSDKIIFILTSLLGIALMSSPIINYNELHSQLSKYLESSIVGFIIGLVLLLFSLYTLKKQNNSLNY